MAIAVAFPGLNSLSRDKCYGKVLHWSQQDRRSVAAASFLSMHKRLRSLTSCKGFLVADKLPNNRRLVADRSPTNFMNSLALKSSAIGLRLNGD